ncbi:hypothetical protein ACLBXM_21835 [Xanthobacteraceae bacterium A53D]
MRAVRDGAVSLLRGIGAFLANIIGQVLIVLALLVLGAVTLFTWDDWTLVNLSIIAATFGVLMLGCALYWRSM